LAFNHARLRAPLRPRRRSRRSLPFSNENFQFLAQDHLHKSLCQTVRTLSTLDNVGGKFAAIMRRDARLETRGLPGVIALQNLRHFMQAGDHGGIAVRHGQVHQFAGGPQLRAQLVDQSARPSPFWRKDRRCRELLHQLGQQSVAPSSRSILLKTMMVGLPAAPISARTALTAAICSAACGCPRPPHEPAGPPAPPPPASP